MGSGRSPRDLPVRDLRGGTPPRPFDRVLASCLGSAAVRAIERVEEVPADHYLVRTARDLDISFAGAED
jgi:hypothetical protein